MRWGGLRFANVDFAPLPFCGNIDTSDESFFEMPNQSDNGCVEAAPPS
jgi:hypothetical protein